MASSTLTASDNGASSRLLPADVLRVGSIGLRTRRLRAALSALGIAIGIASMVAVLGISASSQATLLNTIDQLGTNLLTIQAGQSFFGDNAQLPLTAEARIRAMATTRNSAAVYAVSSTVRRTSYVDAGQTGGITIYAADTNLPTALGATLVSGQFLNAATARYPTVVLGNGAAQLLGLDSVAGHPLVYLGGQQFTVVGILAPLALAPDLDTAVFIGEPVAKALLNQNGHPGAIYVRSDPNHVNDARNVLAASTNAEHPEEVQISRPSDALAARAAAKGAYTSLLLGLGAVALLVGGVGIANVMFISVLERRSEIGLRRALGATRRHIATQFLTESLLLSALGGAAGSLFGSIATAIAASAQNQPTVVPPAAIFAGIGAALLIGALAGVYPSLRAARLSPTDALRST
jgi:putative ABC transport system permease protein